MSLIIGIGINVPIFYAAPSVLVPMNGKVDSYGNNQSDSYGNFIVWI